MPNIDDSKKKLRTLNQKFVEFKQDKKSIQKLNYLQSLQSRLKVSSENMPLFGNNLSVGVATEIEKISSPINAIKQELAQLKIQIGELKHDPQFLGLKAEFNQLNTTLENFENGLNEDKENIDGKSNNKISKMLEFEGEEESEGEQMDQGDSLEIPDINIDTDNDDDMPIQPGNTGNGKINKMS